MDSRRSSAKRPSSGGGRRDSYPWAARPDLAWTSRPTKERRTTIFSEDTPVSRMILKRRQDIRNRIYYRSLKRKARERVKERVGFKIEKRSVYIIFIFILQCSEDNIRIFCSLTYENYGVSHIFLFIILFGIMGVPLQMCQLFLGRYSHLGTLGVWKIAPILAGLGASMVLYTALKTVVFVDHAALSLLYLSFTVKKDLPYAVCTSSPSETNKTKCYTNSSLLPQDFICDIGKGMSYQYPAEYFYRTNFENEGKFHDSWLTTVAIYWFLILLLSSFGYTLILKTIIPQILILILSLLMALAELFMVGKHAGLEKFFHLEGKAFIDFNNWRSVIENVIRTQELGTGILILYGSFFSLKTEPELDSLCLALLYFSVNFVFSMGFHCLTGRISHKHDIKLDCVNMKEWRYAFCALADVISESQSRKAYNGMIYLLILLKSLLYSTLLINSMVENVLKRRPAFQGRQFYVTVSIVALCFTINSLRFVMPKVLIHSMMHFACTALALVFMLYFCIAVFWIYGIQRLADDMQFVMGYEPSLFWKFCWRLISIALPVYVCLYVINLNKYAVKANYDFILGTGIIMLICQLPILAYLFYNLIIAIKNHNIMGLFRTSKSYGRTSKEERRARRYFNPRSEIRYRSEVLKCTHNNCLMLSKEHKNMIEHYEECQKLYTLLFRREKPPEQHEDYKEDDMSLDDGSISNRQEASDDMLLRTVLEKY